MGNEECTPSAVCHDNPGKGVLGVVAERTNPSTNIDKIKGSKTQETKTETTLGGARVVKGPIVLGTYRGTRKN